MKKAKTLEMKLRAAIRMIWSRSSERSAVKKAAMVKDSDYGKAFVCPICQKKWPEKMGEVDHVMAVGSLETWRDIEGFVDRMFFSPQRVICVLCHKKKTAEDRKSMRKKR